MQRLSAAVNKNLRTEILGLYQNNNVSQIESKRKTQRESILRQPPFDVFINHRGIDTRRNVAGILYEHLSGVGLRPFLDCKSMSPGDNLINKIDIAIESCRVGILVFSPRYCESYYCLYELDLMLRSNKFILPIFCNVKPSQLQIPRDGTSHAKSLGHFAWAIEVARCTVGLPFDTATGDWSKLLSNVSNAVTKLVDEDERSMGLNLK